MESLHKTDEPATILREKYAAVVEPIPRGLKLGFPGIAERFELITDSDELTLFAESWHEHFSNLDSLLSFLDGLFSGRLDLVVTYRGDKYIGHRVRVHCQDRSRAASRTWILALPSWRRKSSRVLSYAQNA